MGRSDGEPGWQTLWRGYAALRTLVKGYLLARGELPSGVLGDHKGLLAWKPPDQVQRG